MTQRTASAQPESVMARELTYWTKALAGLPDRIALPVDHPTPARPSRRGGTLAFAIEADLHRRLAALEAARPARAAAPAAKPAAASA